MFRNSIFLSRLFSARWEFHLSRHPNCDYEVCRDPLCYLVWALEWALWYRGGRSHGDR